MTDNPVDHSLKGPVSEPQSLPRGDDTPIADRVETLADALLYQLHRNEQLLVQYAEIQASEALPQADCRAVMAMIQGDLDVAHRAIIEPDVFAMIDSYETLRRNV